MKIGILGTGVVGQTIGAKLAELGHEVMIGTRDVAATLARTEPGFYGNPPFSVWQQQNPTVKVGTFAEAARHGELLINATSGGVTLAALATAGKANLDSKVLIDISNPLDFSKGMPPSLLVSNTDSLAEQIQRAFPAVKVVKTLNTMNTNLMVNPRQLADGDHHVFVSGNDAVAKAQVTTLLKDGFGWRNVVDLGDITTARGTEMLLPIWIRLMGVLQTPLFNFKIVK
ncbi:MAG: NAD(P)-binding domain-containing protein [Chloroflexota bacterium]